jgi:phage-related tail fiber protein
MKVTVKMVQCILLCAVMCIAGGLRAEDGGEVIWWLMGDPKNITAEKDGEIYNAAKMGVNAARIRYENESERGYLSIYAYASADDTVYPTYGDGEAAYVPGAYFASLNGLSGASYSYVIELGNWSDGSWTGASMESAAVSYSDLQAKDAIATWTDKTPTYSQPWTPTQFHVVPEPNSGLMLLVGGALLALRRRRCGKDC